MNGIVVPARVRALLLAGLVFAASAGPGVAGTTACMNPSGQPPSKGSGESGLTAVAATSGCQAWAVGSYQNGTGADQSLVEHWDGTAWNIQPSPAPGGSSDLYGVAATSPSNAWAVGDDEFSSVFGTLIEHWDGASWTVQPSPYPGGLDNFLDGVTATSPTNAWAVGYGYSEPNYQTLIEHWDGTSWSLQSSPNPGPSLSVHTLTGVVATSSTNAWAVGYYDTGTTERTMVLHWDGTAWQVQKSPNPGGSTHPSVLLGVTASSSTNAWAVGYYYRGRARAMVMHWNGTAWKLQKSPNRRGDNVLTGVAATSPTDAWAVGYRRHDGPAHTLVLHWNGTAWKEQKSPNPGAAHHSNRLTGVAATSSTDAWAVGVHRHSGSSRPLALHWDGTSWGP